MPIPNEMYDGASVYSTRGKSQINGVLIEIRVFSHESTDHGNVLADAVNVALDSVQNTIYNIRRDRTVAPTRETWVQLPLFITSD